MRLIENGAIGRKCHKCGKLILYGAKFYHESKNNIDYCYKCGKIIKDSATHCNMLRSREDGIRYNS
jgi:NAD-dependent SIR2 family protein deacetylase